MQEAFFGKLVALKAYGVKRLASAPKRRNGVIWRKVLAVSISS